eukprot:NODE_257_length_12663_cov_0.723655.p10 type:complete len:143 gc:universal NODE_257_length_12663_cov_0.723655:3145-3573(+)
MLLLIALFFTTPIPKECGARCKAKWALAGLTTGAGLSLAYAHKHPGEVQKYAEILSNQKKLLYRKFPPLKTATNSVQEKSGKIWGSPHIESLRSHVRGAGRDTVNAVKSGFEHVQPAVSSGWETLKSQLYKLFGWFGKTAIV